MWSAASFDRKGYAIADLVLTASACEKIADALPAPDIGRGGVRNLLSAPIVQRLLAEPRFAAAVQELVDGPLVAVKATLFDKTPAANWRVQWHQDRVVAVRERRDLPEFGPWSVKDGVPHVEPPARVLERMVAARVHLDDCGPDNGPLRVIPGSHRRGKLSADELRDAAQRESSVELALPQGAILLMRPLLVHASSPSSSANHRRVLHIELAPEDAVAPLQWREAAALR